jgi:hypothetical protein
MLACIDLELVKAIAALIGAGAAVVAILVYRSNSRLQRAKWLADLYEKFYERSDLKRVREVLDCEAGDSPSVSALVRDEPAEFSDYLNFFEFVAVLGKSGQLRKQEIEDLFRYYLDCLENCRAVRNYIAEKGYEQLDRLLRERAMEK